MKRQSELKNNSSFEQSISSIRYYFDEPLIQPACKLKWPCDLIFKISKLDVLNKLPKWNDLIGFVANLSSCDECAVPRTTQCSLVSYSTFGQTLHLVNLRFWLNSSAFGQLNILSNAVLGNTRN